MCHALERYKLASRRLGMIVRRDKDKSRVTQLDEPCSSVESTFRSLVIRLPGFSHEEAVETKSHSHRLAIGFGDGVVKIFTLWGHVFWPDNVRTLPSAG